MKVSIPIESQVGRKGEIIMKAKRADHDVDSADFVAGDSDSHTSEDVEASDPKHSPGRVAGDAVTVTEHLLEQDER